MKFLFAIILLCSLAFASAQTVHNTSYITNTGEKVLRLEVTLPIGKDEAWKLFTNDEQLQKWIAPVAHIELKTGGYIITNYDKSKSLTDTSSIKLGIINYLEHELIAFKVKLNDHFPKEVQAEDGNLQEIIQFIYIESKKTKLVSSMIGWGQGETWNKTYDFFVRGNIYTYEQLIKLFK